jgi:hypothetical protein
MRVGVLDILALPARGATQAAQRFVMTKQYASITPQAVAVWCRQRGHDTSYATYYGLGDPRRLLPSDLDVVFVSSYTWTSSLAYALAKVYRRHGVLTVLGGPHAVAFPADALRFFDVVVKGCDADLIADILAGHHEPGSIASAGKPLTEIPSVEERLPEIRRAAFLGGRLRLPSSFVPLLTSTGCPYTCDFCIDAINPYRTLSPDRLRADLRFLGARLPGVVMGFCDPNFAVRFDETLDVLESVPAGERHLYLMSSSLSNLRGARMKRLGDTRCGGLIVGVESWDAYSNKAGVGRQQARVKLAAVVEHLRQLHEHVPYIQAGFILGLDTDAGDEPFELTKEFMTRAPFVYPAVNIPIPFGGTPLYADLLGQGRLLTAMPFSFYGSHLVTRLEHYDVVSFYERLLDLVTHQESWAQLRLRLASVRHPTAKLAHLAYHAGNRSWATGCRWLLNHLRADRTLRAFHDGGSTDLPELYHYLYEQTLGGYAELMSRRDRRPLPDAAPARPAVMAGTTGEWPMLAGAPLAPDRRADAIDHRPAG